MSESIDAFYNVVLEDEQLQGELSQSASQEELIASAVKLGASRGFSFDAAAVAAKLDSLKAADDSVELSDAELVGVAGGYVSFGGSILCGYCGSQSGTSGGRAAKVSKSAR